MNNEVNGENRYHGYVYFILPDEEMSMLRDTITMKKIDELHRDKRIDYVFLKSGGSYPCVEKYCYKNYIELENVEDNSELVEEVIRHYGKPNSKRFAYVTNSKNAESLDRAFEELADWGFYSEIRLPNSF